MEPKLPAPNSGPERPQSSYSLSIESAPSVPNPERAIEQRQEQFEQRSETAPVGVATNPVLPPPVLPVVPAPTDDNSTVLVPTDDVPLVANDEDLIEKEWVDKAKKIIVETKDDPYRREQEVGKLQADYLLKRYGRELGAPQ